MKPLRRLLVAMLTYDVTPLWSSASAALAAGR